MLIYIGSEDIKIIKIIQTIKVILLLSMSPATFGWTIKMDFEGGPLGASVQDSGNGYDVFSDAAGATVYDADCGGNVLNGHCAKMSITKGSDGWGQWGGRINFVDAGVSNLVVGDEVWVSVKMYMPKGFDYTANPHLKFLRFHTMSATAENEGYNDLYITPDGVNHWDPVLNKDTDAPYFFVKEQDDKLRYFGDFDIDRPKLGVWESYEMYLYMDATPVSSGGKSRVIIWKNGKLLADLKDVQTLKTANSFSETFLIFTYWNGGNPAGTGAYPTQDQHLFIDDLTITTDKPPKQDIHGNNYIGDLVAPPPSPPSQLLAE